jgi:hypothetical protein
MINPRDVATMESAVHVVNGMIGGADNVVPGEAGGIGNKGVEVPSLRCLSEGCAPLERH